MPEPRDPFDRTTQVVMGVNLGRQPLHLESGPAQRFRETIGLVLPELEQLRRRLAAIAGRLAVTRHSLRDEGETVSVACPRGNCFRIHGRCEGFPRPAGIPYAAMDVPVGAASRIAALSAGVLPADVRLEDNAFQYRFAPRAGRRPSTFSSTRSAASTTRSICGPW